MNADPREVLQVLLDAIVAAGSYVDLEADRDGSHPVLRGYRALGLRPPEELRVWFQVQDAEGGLG